MAARATVQEMLRRRVAPKPPPTTCAQSTGVLAPPPCREQLPENWGTCTAAAMAASPTYSHSKIAQQGKQGVFERGRLVVLHKEMACRGEWPAKVCSA